MITMSRLELRRRGVSWEVWLYLEGRKPYCLCRAESEQAARAEAVQIAEWIMAEGQQEPRGLPERVK